ncbi:unnamed protein product [Nippostrongylus brasiliensis]|uniref:Methyltransf_21 domain-containing protein n=1 Tax=Nippostrongylus brasiliensis TaxID=27835 RepID=A0A0N4YL14_NIPBR|nr:unnamed protein product [Nippostrongylus brasiliensis]
MLANGDDFVEFLKVDIERAEHKILIPFLREHSVCQLLIEIHGNTTQHAALLKEVALLDYLLFAREANPWCQPCCEYSFINRNCMDRYGAYILKPYLKDIAFVNHNLIFDRCLFVFGTRYYEVHERVYRTRNVLHRLIGTVNGRAPTSDSRETLLSVVCLFNNSVANLHIKYPLAKDPNVFYQWMNQLWFAHYSRAKGKAATSGFVHVFIGEAVMASVKFSWRGDVKQSGSLLFDTSPEYDVALYSLCFPARRGQTQCKTALHIALATDWIPKCSLEVRCRVVPSSLER